MKKTLVLTVICLTLLCGCGKTPKLQNGEEAVVTFKKDKKEHKISAEELYEEFKSNYGLEATVKLIDTYILETEFADYIDTAKETADTYTKAAIQYYGGENEFLSELRNRTNYSSIEAYTERLYLDAMEDYALKEYAKTLVDDKEIKKYYEESVKEDIELYHILILPKVTDGMSDEEKEKAETKAKNTAKEIIKKLDESKESNKLSVFKQLVKEYSEDDATKDKDGNLGYLNYGDLGNAYNELLDEGYKIKNGKYSKNVVTSELGYHVIFRASSKEKDTLENVKNDIIDNLAESKINNNSKLYVESLKYYRKLYNMDIVDSELNRQYGIYMNNLTNQKSN